MDIKRIILEEVDDFDWVSDTAENPLGTSDVPQKIWMLGLARWEQKKIYDYLISLGFNGNISIESIIESDKYKQKLAILILNVDNRVYYGDEEIEVLDRGEEKPRPKGKLGSIPFYTYGNEEQNNKQLEQLHNTWDNTYGGYFEIDSKELLDLIEKK